MKKSGFILLFLIAYGFTSIAQEEIQVAFKKGTVLIYDMIKGSETIPFTVTIVSLKPDLVFTYKIEGSVKKNGKITITKNAMAKSLKWSFNFNQPTLKFTNTTSIFVSWFYYKKIDSLASVTYDNPDLPGDSLLLRLKIVKPDTAILIGRFSRENEEIFINDKQFKLKTYSVDHVIDAEGNPVDFGTSFIFRVARNTEFPIITYANLVSYSLVLKEVRNAQWLRYNFATNEYERVNEMPE